MSGSTPAGRVLRAVSALPERPRGGLGRGLLEVVRALERRGKDAVALVYLAADGPRDAFAWQVVRRRCTAEGIPVVEGLSRAELGTLAGIDHRCAAVSISRRTLLRLWADRPDLHGLPFGAGVVEHGEHDWARWLDRLQEHLERLQGARGRDDRLEQARDLLLAVLAAPSIVSESMEEAEPPAARRVEPA